MDYKYITQLLDRYWKAETTVEEENILRAFFSQTSVPEELKQYRCLFLYQATEPKTDVLDAAFDDRLLAIVGEEQKGTAKVKAHRITLKERMFPLFKAAAVVAIILTLGNAAQYSFNGNADTTTPQSSTIGTSHGQSMAYTDSATIDTLQQRTMDTTSPVDNATTVIK